jgi:hypothetical protein
MGCWGTWPRAWDWLVGRPRLDAAAYAQVSAPPAFVAAGGAATGRWRHPNERVVAAVMAQLNQHVHLLPAAARLLSVAPAAASLAWEQAATGSGRAA